MTEQDVKDILEQIMELASMLEWRSIIVQSSDGQLLGMYLGTDEFVEYKKNKHSTNQLH